MDKILKKWVKVQAAWIYLEPIFESNDMKLQMLEESQMFLELDEIW